MPLCLGGQEFRGFLDPREVFMQLYDAYMKHRQALSLAKAKYHVDDVLDLVHGNLYSPITLATPDGRRYFLLSIDG